MPTRTPNEQMDALFEESSLSFTERMGVGLGVVDQIIPMDRIKARAALDSARELISDNLANPAIDPYLPPKETIAAFTNIAQHCPDAYIGSRVSYLGRAISETVYPRVIEDEDYYEQIDPDMIEREAYRDLLKGARAGDVIESGVQPEGSLHEIHANDDQIASIYVIEDFGPEGRGWFVDQRMNQVATLNEDALSDGGYRMRKYTRFDDINELRSHLTKDCDIPASAEAALASGSLAGSDTYKFTPADLDRIEPVWMGTDVRYFEPDCCDETRQPNLEAASHHGATYLGSQFIQENMRVCDGIDGRTDSRINDRIVTKRVDDYEGFKIADNARQMRDLLQDSSKITDGELVNCTALAWESSQSAKAGMPEFNGVRCALNDMARKDISFSPRVTERLSKAAANHPEPVIASLMTKACDAWTLNHEATRGAETRPARDDDVR